MYCSDMLAPAYIDMQDISRVYGVIKDFIRVSWQDYYVIILR